MRDYLRIRTIAPSDVSFAERQDHYRAKKRKRDRERARQRRAANRGLGPRRSTKTARRAKLLSTVLRADEGRAWWSITRLRDAVQDGAAFAGLTSNTARRAIARALKGLHAAGLLEQREFLGPRTPGASGISLASVRRRLFFPRPGRSPGRDLSLDRLSSVINWDGPSRFTEQRRVASSLLV